MDSLTLDQMQIFLTVFDEGSFSKAAKKLNRAQSAITYGVQKLEAQIGMSLFDRTAYRPALTEAGRALLVRARRVVEEANGFRDKARSLASGLEAELTIVVDSMFPMTAVVAALRAFTAQFPTVPPRIYVQSLGAAADLVLDGTCMIGLLPLFFSEAMRLRRFPLLTIELVPVAAPDHPLARMKGPIDTEVLHKHVQLVLTDRSAATEGRDYGVLSGRTWRLADLGAKQSMLLAGLGWGNMPAHLVADDIANGRLKVIRPQAFDKENAQLTMCGASLADRALGPAGQWVVDNLPATSKAWRKTH
jgi:DNA-binding transcriptional LysR family regulator